MSMGLSRGVDLRLERHLLFFSALLVVACVAYIPYTPGGIVPDIPAVTIPLAVSVGLMAFAFRVHSRRTESPQSEHIVGYGWLGLLVAAAISGWGLAILLYTGAPIGGAFALILSLVALGVGAGVVVGNHRDQTQNGSQTPATARRRDTDDTQSDRERVLDETFWTGRQTDEAIFETIIEALAEAEGVHPTDVGPVYEYINPDTFSTLQRREGSQWQLAFYTEQYEVRVSSQGTVTVYDATGADEPSIHSATQQ